MEIFTLNCKGRLLSLNTPVVMGIINATPDSFYQKSRSLPIDDALRKAEQMLQEGAVILDIGGQSTRPGSNLVGEDEEIKRVVPVIHAIAMAFPEAFISVDTFQSRVATAAIDAGAVIVNDISGGSFDPKMTDTVAANRVPYVCMHLTGDAAGMHTQQNHGDIISDLLDYFTEKIKALNEKGIHDMIIDPGFGFSKTVADNFHLIKQLNVFSILRKPILLGVSRKSSIYKTLGITPEESLNGTTVLNTAGLLKGASILRVHDVKEAMEAIRLSRYLV